MTIVVTLFLLLPPLHPITLFSISPSPSLVFPSTSISLLVTLVLFFLSFASISSTACYTITILTLTPFCLFFLPCSFGFFILFYLQFSLYFSLSFPFSSSSFTSRSILYLYLSRVSPPFHILFLSISVSFSSPSSLLSPFVTINYCCWFWICFTITSTWSIIVI